ncbi:ketoacyl-ACP synthase III [Desmospora activa]|uniref:Beta-ketoacyl-[acyl-carrier-protein] synthase III n=1 Tax=Desmospora activa DSM 45169 TaxID=1121389 RepID=A0A2T4Z6Z1_9BACL|nr:ketoacyl-ACP synthase III [Desmospora activa]PTM57663.1 3-oxoacyl-[acyl-carrier-protein] synthase-3 [Desmospora activa DSM 45169]
MQSKATITAIGIHVPEEVIGNDYFETIVDTSDEWIVQRTGIRERRFAGKQEFTSDLAITAVTNMIQQYDIKVDDVDMILVATSTPDHVFPSVASRIQSHFEIKHTGAIDLHATCAGFVYGLNMANALVTAGMNRKVLVIGAETLSKTTDFSDRTTCILFGDGAGAALVEYTEENPGFLASYIGATKGEGGIHLYRTHLSDQLDGQPVKDHGQIVQNGREVYRWAVTTVPTGMHSLMDQTELSLDDVDWFIPHSANARMIETICEKSGFPLEKTLMSMERYGNTSAATIPLALAGGIREGKVQSGDTLLLYGFGGGLVHAGLLLKWLPTKTPR